MKKLILLWFLMAVVAVLPAQTQHMKFMGIDLNCTQSTFISKLKGKGFVEDNSGSHENRIFMKGTFAGEKVKLEIRSASKSHLVHSVFVCFNLSTSYSYDALKAQLSKYGEYTEVRNVKEDDGVVKYVTDYARWDTDTDPETGNFNSIVLYKCSYRSTSPFVIAYLDRRNALLDVKEVSSDF